MLRYVIGILAGFTGFIAIWVGLFFLSFGILETHGDRTIAAWYQVKREAARSNAKEKKIVFAGGSNVLYGVSAATVEKALGIPCVNFGTHAGLPLEYILFRLRKAVKPEDVVVISLEWEYLNRTSDDLSFVFPGFLLGGDPQYFWNLTLKQQVRICLSAPLSRLMLPLTTTPMASSGLQNIYVESIRGSHIDSRGDVMGNPPELRAKPELARILGLDLHPCTLAEAADDSDFWKTVRQFLSWAKKKRVTVVFAAPSLLANPSLTSDAYRKIFAAAERHYEKLGVPVIARQNANFYGEDLMFDSIYHLNSSGREIRARQLIEGLKPVLSDRPTAR